MIVLETYTEQFGLPDFEPERRVINQQFFLDSDYQRVELLSRELYGHLTNLNEKKGSKYGCRFYEV